MPEAAAAPESEPEAFDVAIIGGGINGCGTFRDLCAQGVKCLLIERDDFAAGASAASSRLMHGGLKYLETGEFRLVRESLPNSALYGAAACESYLCPAYDLLDDAAKAVLIDNLDDKILAFPFAATVQDNLSR